MKILFLTHYYTPEGNAPATRVSALAERWVKAGHEVTVMTCAPNVPNGVLYEGYRNRWTVHERINGVNVIRVWTYIAPNKGTFRRILNYVSYMFSAFLHGLFMKKPDVMIATSPQFFCGWAGVLLHWFRRFPFVLEIRDIWPESIASVNAELPKTALKIVGWMERCMYRSSGFIVTVGEGYRKKLIEERGVPAEKVSIVMNGVDTALFSPRGKNEKLLAEYGLSGKFICSYIGTVGMACGLHVVLDAAEQLQKEGDEHIRFVIVGDGAVREDLEKESAARNLKNVVFTGRRPKKEMPDWVASSDVNLVHLKKTDLFATVMPSKIFEAAGCARPMIIGVEGFAKDFVLTAEAGIPMTPESPAELLHALKQLAGDPALCEKLGRNGYDRICSKYNRDSQAEDYLRLLSEVNKFSREEKNRIGTSTMKRFFDILLSGFAVFCLSPLLIPVIIILKLTGEHYIFYRQDRIGKGRKIFGLLKFATMLKNSPNMGTGEITLNNDPRVLPFGKFLRKTKINELPQLFNILSGEMSIIGPRPLTPKLFAYYSEEVQEGIGKMPPGLSGIGSIIFRDEETIMANSGMDSEECYRNHIIPYKGALELWYLEHRSLMVDALIIFLTVWVILFPKSRLPYQCFKTLPEKPEWMN